MSQALHNLLNLLNLEKLEEGLFRGQSEDLGLRQVFGGQVVGQALYAAKQTVPEARIIHSFHSYFLRRRQPESHYLRCGNPARRQKLQRPPRQRRTKRSADLLHDRLLPGTGKWLRTSEQHAAGAGTR